MSDSWITLLALFSSTAGLSSSFAPALSTHRWQSLTLPLPLPLPLPSGGTTTTTTTKLFQSSIASGAEIGSLKRYNLHEEHVRGGDSDSSSRSSVIDVRKLDANTAYTPTISSATATATTVAPTTTTTGVDAEEQLAILRSKSIKELKLKCSRRNIQYGKFSETEEYVQAIWQEMEKTFAFSVTGLVRPGALVELTGEQLDQEMTRKESLILVDVYATWCGPCRVIIPQLEMAAKKLMGDKVRVVKLDSDKHSSWAGRYQVQGLPTMLLIKEGLVVDRLEGAYMTNEIVNFVQQHIA